MSIHHYTLLYVVLTMSGLTAVSSNEIVGGTQLIEIVPNLTTHGELETTNFLFKSFNITAVGKLNGYLEQTPACYTTSEQKGSVVVFLKTEFRLIHIYVHNGTANIQVKLCHEGRIVRKMYITKGWTTLHFNISGNIKHNGCIAPWESSQPAILFNGSATFNVFQSKSIPKATSPNMFDKMIHMEVEFLLIYIFVSCLEGIAIAAIVY